MSVTYFFRRIQNTLIALLIVSTLIPVLIVGGYSVSYSAQTITELSLNKIEQKTADSAARVETFLESISKDVLYLVETPPVQGIVRAREGGGVDKKDKSSYEAWVGRLQIIFAGMIEAKPYYSNLRYLNENGKEMVRVDAAGGRVRTVPPSELRNLGETDDFIETIKLEPREIYVSPVGLDKENGKIRVPHTPSVRYSTPIYSREGKKKGILIASLRAESFLALLKESQLQSSQLFVLNRDGYYLSHPDTQKEFGFELNKEEKVSRDYPEKIADQLLSGGKGVISEGAKQLLSYYTLYLNPKKKQNPLIFGSQLPKDVVFSTLASFQAVIFNVAFLSLVAVLVLGIAILRKLVSLIREITGAVSSFSVQVMATIEEQERLAGQQASAVQQTTVTMDELGASSQKSAEQAEAAARGASQVLILANGSSSETSQPTVAEGVSLREKMAQIAERIVQLSQLVSQINKIANTVSNFADQTNMLALNASVEAVRAGEHGRGFGVVAAEIRKLSDRSRTSAEQINNLVGDIQLATSSTVLVTDEGTKTVAAIVSAVSDIVLNVQQISLSARQHATAIEQVVNAMNSLNQGAAEAATGMKQTKIGTQKLNQAAQQLKAAV
ncbi:MAG: methyl-accepting chemotaxis protein [Oscillatoria princeps RMCB-10]|nr:methyl-accepting chemotaxis protein [Oscillatoria princeps RMCB-10]